MAIVEREFPKNGMIRHHTILPMFPLVRKITERPIIYFVLIIQDVSTAKPPTVDDSNWVCTIRLKNDKKKKLTGLDNGPQSMCDKDTRSPAVEQSRIDISH
jgi:hypothetical protein